MIDKKVLKRILAETFNDVITSTYGRGVSFRLFDSTEFVGYFVGYSLVEMCENHGSPKLTPRFLCFNTEGVRTSCDPHFDEIEDFYVYHETMNQLEYWEQQIDIKQTLDAISQLHAGQIPTNS
jgi:hypothetical protein